MSLKMLGILGVSFVLGCGGIGTMDQPVSVQEIISQEQYPISVELEKVSETKTNDDDAPLLTVEKVIPKVTVLGNEQATARINDYYAQVNKELETNVQTILGYAIENYGFLSKEQLQYWNGYAVGLSYKKGRVDQKVISLIRDYYEYAGGAHPNSLRYAENFRPDTGELLTLQTVTKNGQQSLKEINTYLLNLTKNETYKGYFFEGYEKNLPEILSDSTWYLSDEGFVVIANEYIIGPHALGILEFVIPYKDATFLKEEYMK